MGAEETSGTYPLAPDAIAALEKVAMAPTVDVDLPTQQKPPPKRGGGGKGRPAADHPEFIAHYRIVEEIGEGGMGIVYKAEQREPVRRVVALKVIKLGMDTKEVVARFDAERQALAMMNHPNVAKVFEAGMTPEGRPYFAMEYVPGVPLTQYCDDSKLTTHERLALFVEVCHAIQHAHQKGIIHRDLKPSNVLVTLFDGKPVPKVIDFGIAKATNQQLTQHTLFTQTGALIGTPEYMSPEQAQTSGLDVDTRTDVYSLGVMLYELLTGTLPFDPESLREAGLDEMARIIRESEPPKPSTKLGVIEKTPTPKPGASPDELAKRRRCDFRTLQRQLRGDLDWIVVKAMEKDRTRRYETASSLATDIQRYLVNEPVSAGAPSTFYRLSKFVRRNRGLFFAGTAIFVALVAGLASATVGLVQARHANRRLGHALIDTQQARDEAERERNAAQAQRAEADRQRSLAELSLAAGLIPHADALDMAGRWNEAGAKYLAAYEAFARLKQPTLAAEVGLWSHYDTSPPCLLTLRGHVGAVKAIALSPDGRTAISAGADRMLRVWDTRTGVMLRTMSGHAEGVLCVAISPDGSQAVSGSQDRTIKLWDVASGTEVRTFTGHGGAVNGVAFGPDRQTILSGSEDHTLKRWNAKTGELVSTFTGSDSGISAIALSPDGQLALSASADAKDATVLLWDVRSASIIRTLRGHTGWVACVAFSSDGRLALSGGDDNTMRLWDIRAAVASGDAGSHPLRTFRGHARRVESVAFSADGRYAISASADRTLKLWSLNNEDEIRTFRGHEQPATGAAFLPDGRTALSSSEDGTLKLWDVQTAGDTRKLGQHASRIASVAFSPDGRLALTGSYDNTLKLSDVHTGQDIHTFTGHSAAVLCTAFSPDGRMAISGSADQSIELWDIESGSEVRSLTGHTESVLSVAFSPDGHTALSGSADQTVGLWDVSSGTELKVLRGHGAAVTSVAFAPDGRTAASGSEDHTIKLWDLETGKEIRTLRGHADRVLCVAFSPDGKQLLSSSEDKTLKLWDVQSGSVLRTMTGHDAAVLSAAFGPGGHTAVSGGADHTLKLWNLDSGAEMRTFDPRGGMVLSVAFAPTGQAVLSSAYDDKAATLWDFQRAREYLRLTPAVDRAEQALQQDPQDGAAMATLGEWYAFRGMTDWAIDLLMRARMDGATVSSLLLGQCYWKSGKLAEAAHEFHKAAEETQETGERAYLRICLAGIKAAAGPVSTTNVNEKGE